MTAVDSKVDDLPQYDTCDHETRALMDEIIGDVDLDKCDDASNYGGSVRGEFRDVVQTYKLYRDDAADFDESRQDTEALSEIIENLTAVTTAANDAFKKYTVHIGAGIELRRRLENESREPSAFLGAFVETLDDMEEDRETIFAQLTGMKQTLDIMSK